MAHVDPVVLSRWWVAGWHPPMIPRTSEMYRDMSPVEKGDVAAEYHDYFGTAGVWGGQPAWGDDYQGGGKYEGTLDWYGRRIGAYECDPRVVGSECYDDGGGGSGYEEGPPDGSSEIRLMLDTVFTGVRVRIWTFKQLARIKLTYRQRWGGMWDKELFIQFRDLNGLVGAIDEINRKYGGG